MARRQGYHYGSNGADHFDQHSGQNSNGPGIEDNDYLVDGLRSKVNVLKSLTLDMGDEIKGQNSFLKEMDNEFDSTWGLLSSSMGRVKRLASSGHNRLYLYLMLFSLFVFFFIYLIIRFR